MLVRSGVASIALSICLYIAKIAHMTHLVFWSSVNVAVRVVVGASRDASVRQVTVNMDVEAMELSWSQTSEGASHQSACERTLLLEVNDAFTCLVRLRVHDADSTAGINWRLSHLTIDGLLFDELHR